MTLRELPHAGDLIGKAVVPHVPVIRVVKGLRATGQSHPVELNDDEAELGQRACVSTQGVEAATADAAALRTGIVVDDDRIPLCRIEGARPVQQTVQVRPSVTRFYR